MIDSVDVIILSLVTNDDSFKKTQKCIDSYIDTADELIRKIYVVESNENFSGNYNQKKVEVIKPGGEFNYNKFYNIALEKCTAQYVMGPNNDIEIQPNCLQTIVKEFEQNKELSSICPIDRDWHRHTTMYLPNNEKLYYGYEVSLHMFGCVFCCRRSVFEKIGYLDEAFYFFYQDNDYAMCLERNNLLHGVHTGARVKHISGFSNENAPARCKYTSENMNAQGDILAKKWNSEPFKSGGYKQYREYKL
jgi:GT2 family glycosyltransferase